MSSQMELVFQSAVMSGYGGSSYRSWVKVPGIQLCKV